MRLDVGLVHHVEPVAVTQPVEQRQVGVVAGANGVNVERLHAAQVVLDDCPCLHVTERVVVLVAIYTFYIDRHAVHQQARAFDFDAAEATLCATTVGGRPSSVRGVRMQS